MKNRIHPVFVIFILALFNLIFLTQCDLILGGGDKTGNVGIDLGGFYEDGRAISGFPLGITVTGFRITVFGPGMTKIEKYISAGTRYVNMYVPSGQERNFTLDMYFTVTNPSLFPYTHVRSFKGRAVADLRPGYFVGLVFHMAAGETKLLIPDYNMHRVWQGNDIHLNPLQYDILGFTGTLSSFSPLDIEVDSEGRIFTPFTYDGWRIQYANSLSGGAATYISVPSATFVYCLGMDRDARFDINHDMFIDTNILYFPRYATDPLGTTLYYSVLADTNGIVTTPIINNMTPPGMLIVTGMTVDPWTHMLYMVGFNESGEMAIVKYNPKLQPGDLMGQVVATVTNPDVFRTLMDIIVKDDTLFVLNVVTHADQGIPVLLKFDKNLNYLGGFGQISTDGAQYIASSAPGMFYQPIRFIAKENDGLYIIDDSDRIDSTGDADFDKLVYIDTDLNPASWQTYPSIQPGPDGIAGDPFRFIQ